MSHLDEEGQQPETFCICQTSDDGRLMIECSANTAGCGGWVHPDCFLMSPQAVAAVASEDTWACPLCTGDIENVDEARLEARQRSEAAAAAYLAASAAAAKPDAKPIWESDDEDELDADDDVDDEEDYESGDDDAPKKKRAAPAFPRPRGRPPKKDKPKAAKIPPPKFAQPFVYEEVVCLCFISHARCCSRCVCILPLFSSQNLCRICAWMFWRGCALPPSYLCELL
jgi:hypothetical protein